MKTPAIVGIAMVVGVGIGWYFSRTLENSTPDGAENQASPPAGQFPTVSLSEAEKEELVRLRKEVPELLRLRGQVAQLRQEREAESQRGVGQAQAPTAGRFVPAQHLANVGLATPEAGLQTFMAAMVAGDIQGALAAAVPLPEGQLIDRTQVEQALRRLPGLRGMQIIAKKGLSDDRVDIETLDFEEGQAPITVVHHMVKIGTEWRYSDSITAWPGWGREGQVQSITPESSSPRHCAPHAYYGQENGALLAPRQRGRTFAEV